MFIENDLMAELIIFSIKNDHKSGANELTRDMLNRLYNYAATLEQLSVNQSKKRLYKLANLIKPLRPNMAPLQNILREWQARIEKLTAISTKEFIGKVQSVCLAVAAEMATRQQRQIEHAKHTLTSARVILTISRSSAVTAIFKQLPEPSLKFIVCESRPGFEGKALAMELASARKEVEYIVDAAAGVHMQYADAVVVGADAVLADGAVINKCGSSLLAMSANYYGIPFYVVADTTKCLNASRKEFILEEIDPNELDAPVSGYIHPRNFYFDTTDPRFISAYITESATETRWPWGTTEEILMAG